MPPLVFFKLPHLEITYISNLSFTIFKLLIYSCHLAYIVVSSLFIFHLLNATDWWLKAHSNKLTCQSTLLLVRYSQLSTDVLCTIPKLYIGGNIRGRVYFRQAQMYLSNNIYQLCYGDAFYFSQEKMNLYEMYNSCNTLIIHERQKK